MKRVLLISLLAFLSISFAFGQSIYGLRAGLNISSYGGDGDMDRKIGFNAGMLMQHRVHPMLIIQPELNYTQRGGQDEGSVMGVDLEVKQTLHYAELPIYLKLDLGEGNLKFQPYLGPEFRYLIAAKYKIKAGSEEDDGDINDVVDLDFGMGLGIDMLFNTNMLFGVRYSMGISDIADGPGEVKNNALMLNLGFLY
jgi:hypothetical protein